MAESPELDFRNDFSPTIPEITINVQCPSTPGPQLNIKSPELSTASSAEETEVVRGDGSLSPPPNCAICLGKCRNKCFTDSCMHQFCFKCLLEWSKVKPECPLCKQTFKSIIHNVKSIDQFEEYLVQQPVPVSPNPDVYPPFTIPAHLYPRLPPLYNRPMHIYMDDLAMNTLDLTGTSSSTSNNANLYPYDGRIMPDPAQLMDMYSQENSQGETGSGSLSQLWRRYVYDRKLYAVAMPDVTGRFRECSARFYRDNPSQTHRLMQWIRRDIVCLLRNTDHDVDSVMEQINASLMNCNILSPEFRRRLQPFLGTKTAHFIHELHNFARSPFDMIGYDRVVQYSSRSTDEIVIEFSSTSSAGSDVESVYQVQIHSHSDPGTSARNNLQQNATPANSGGGFNLYTSTNAASSQASAINLSTHNRGASGDLSEETTTTSTVEVISAPTSERPDNIVLSSTSSDECQFVLEQKPPHLRTPEMVSLNSNSDSDVVFVQETKTTPMPSGITKWASTNSTRVRRPQRRRANPTLNTNSFSTSNSDSDDFNYAEASASASKKMKLDGRDENAVVDTTSGAGAAGDNNNSTNDPIPKVKEEFNQGASTSTGLQSRYRVRTRYYYKPINDTSDSDDLDDSRSSNSDSGLTTEGSNSESDSDTSWSKSRRKSNKQSLKRSRHRKISNTTSRRKTRQQPPASSKSSKRSKRTKTSKTVSTKSTSASTSKKKKTIKHSRSRRKSSKSKSTRTKRRSQPQIDSITSAEEDEDEEEEEPQTFNEDILPWMCTTSSPTSTNNRPSENEPTQSPSQSPQLRSTISSPSPTTSNSTIMSDANDVEERPSSSATLAAPSGSLTPSSPDLPLDADDNPNAKLPIYSDSD